MRAWLISLFAILTAVGCGSPRSAPAPASQKAAVPTSDPAALRGVLLDLYTRRPLASAPVALTALSYGCKMPEMKTTADAEGRFRFEGLPACRPDDNLHLMVQACAGCMAQNPQTADGKELVMVPRSSSDLGTLFVGNDTWATGAFAGTCKGSTPPAETPARSLVVLGLADEGNWRAHSYLYGDLLRDPFLPWPAVLCVRSTEKDVGTYGSLGAAGRAVTTRTTLVRLTDGRRFSGAVTAQPPRRADVTTGARGDTTPLVRDWMKKIADANP